jgi:hypothetical protein
MAKRIPNAAEVAASLGQPPPRPAPPGRYPRLRPEERAEIVRSVRFTRAQIGYLNRVAGEQTRQTGRSISISDVLRQLIDEKLARSD